MTRNRNYETALAYVREKYPWLFTAGLLDISLVPFDGRCYGKCIPFSQVGINQRSSKVQIMNSRHDVTDFVDTIVHELIHSYDMYTGVETTERRAQDLAFEAVETYKRERNIPIWA